MIWLADHDRHAASIQQSQCVPLAMPSCCALSAVEATVVVQPCINRCSEMPDVSLDWMCNTEVSSQSA